MKKNPHIGSTFQEFLEAEGIAEEVNAAAIKHVLAWQIEQAMKAGGITKSALLFRLKERSSIPLPTKPRRHEILVPASPSVAAKVAFVRAFQAAGLTRVALAARLGVRESEVRRMLDPDHGTKLDRLDDGMRALGRRLVIADQPADAA